MSNWLYESGEDRHKHHWQNDYAGFQLKGSERIGKCQNTITEELAQKLLNDGIHLYNPRKNIGCPNEIFNIYNGAIYKAVPTRPGCSYHGYPETKIPKETEKELLERAERQNCKKEVQKWLKKHRTLKKK